MYLIKKHIFIPRKYFGCLSVVFVRNKNAFFNLIFNQHILFLAFGFNIFNICVYI